MAQYIDKSALVAEIESKKKRAQILGDNAINGSMQQFYDGMKQGCVDILSFLDTLKVKEVDSTDAFIEKALKFLDGCIPDYIELIHANVDTFMDVDNKRFIDDFRNYMKE